MQFSAGMLLHPRKQFSSEDTWELLPDEMVEESVSNTQLSETWPASLGRAVPCAECVPSVSCADVFFQLEVQGVLEFWGMWPPRSCSCQDLGGCTISSPPRPQSLYTLLIPFDPFCTESGHVARRRTSPTFWMK